MYYVGYVYNVPKGHSSYDLLHYVTYKCTMPQKRESNYDEGPGFGRSSYIILPLQTAGQPKYRLGIKSPIFATPKIP